MDSAAALRTSQLLARIGDPAAGDRVEFFALLHEFRERAFGALLLLALLPTFLPAPGIGAFTGPFIALVGLQMLLTYEQPWLPKWIGRRHLKRATVQRFGKRFRPLLTFIERVCRPRLVVLIEHVAARAFSGLQIVLLGLVLSLPLPGTNYPLGIILRFYCIALIERDGALLLMGWALGLGALVVTVVLSNEAVALIGSWIG
jgi:hypothetical protein